MEGFLNLIGHLEGVPQPPCRGLTITMIINHLQVLGWSSKYLIFRLFWGRVGFPLYKPYPWSPYIGEYWVPSLKLTARIEKIPFWEKIMFGRFMSPTIWLLLFWCQKVILWTYPMAQWQLQMQRFIRTSLLESNSRGDCSWEERVDPDRVFLFGSIRETY